VRILLNGRRGKVGSVLAPALEQAGHTLLQSLAGAEAMVDFTRPDAVLANVRAAVAAGVPCVIGTTGWDPATVRDAPVAVFYAPNFALGAVLMTRFAEEAARYLEQAEIVELHHAGKLDAPSGTARLIAERLGGNVLLTIRHDATSREAYVPGVLLALERLATLPAGLTVGLDAIL
jgi:4-hydroxy-tetrahydrodipicolinate reductase